MRSCFDPLIELKGKCRVNETTYRNDIKPIPQPIKETSADRQNSPRQQKNIASGEKQWIANSSPCSPTHHALLRCFDKTDNRNEARKHNCHCNCDNERSNLPANHAAELRHPQILLASLASRKSRQLHYRDEKFVLT